VATEEGNADVTIDGLVNYNKIALLSAAMAPVLANQAGFYYAPLDGCIQACLQSLRFASFSDDELYALSMLYSPRARASMPVKPTIDTGSFLVHKLLKYPAKS